MEKIRAIIDGTGVISSAVVSELGRKVLREASQTKSFVLSVSDLEKIWHRLRWTACSSSVADKHLTATCNAVCVFLRCASQSDRVEIKAYAFSEQVWFGGFEIVRKAFGDGKNKPGLQVLDCLIQLLLDHESPASAEEVLKVSITEMLEIIMAGTPHLRLKEACVVLSVFIRKTQGLVPFAHYFEKIGSQHMLKFKQRCLRNNIELPDRCPSDQETLSNFLLALLLTASTSEPRTAAIKLFSLLCSRTDQIDMSQNVDTASGVIEMFILANEAAIKEFVADVFPAVLNESDQLKKFLEHIDLSLENSTSRLSIYLAILQVGRQKGLVTEKELPKILKSALADLVYSTDTVSSEYDTFQYILSCDSLNIRLQAFSLLTISSAATSFVPPDALKCLTQSLKYMYEDTDAYYRDEFVSIARRFLNRLDCGGQAAQRLGKESADGDNGAHGVDAQYNAFLQAWVSFLRIELSPQASYPRHILALKSLRLILSTQNQGRKTQIISLDQSKGLVLALVDLMFDAFDDVRSQAALILDQVSLHNHELVDLQVKQSRVIESGQELSAVTNRADHADALGRFYTLETSLFYHATRSAVPRGGEFPRESLPISRLANAVETFINGSLFLDTSSTFPLHGSLSGLHHSINTFAEKQLELDSGLARVLLRICHGVWALVQGELCVDSPETATEEDEDPSTEGPKDLLAYAWRALRDSSMIMQSMLDSISPDHALYGDLGSLCFEQLTKLRHRGAFSTVAQTFSLCCAKCRNTHEHAFLVLVQSWTESAFKEIENQSSKLTRRSAGLPAMFAALLDPANPTEFLRPIDTLTQLARTPADMKGSKDPSPRLPQVHALNCLKDIMTNSRFRVVTESLVVEMLNLASYSLGSRVWAIRNCGLMLFRACINRLSPDSSALYGQSAAYQSGGNVETPLAVAIRLLRTSKNPTHLPHSDGDDATNEQSEVVFAALDLLDRIPVESNNDLEVDRLIDEQLGSKLWAVREQAARLAALRRADGSQIRDVEKILHDLDSSQSSNFQHGKLLTGRCLLAKCQTLSSSGTSGAEFQRMCDALWRSIERAFKHPLHPVVASGFVDLLNDVFAMALARSEYQSEAAQVSTISRHLRAKDRQGSSFFLSHRALELNRMYSLIHDLVNGGAQKNRTGTEVKSYQDLSSDQNVTVYVVEELLARLSVLHAPQLVHVFSDISSESDSSEVKAAAMLGVSQVLPHIQTQLAGADIARLTRNLDLLDIKDRNSWNAQIRLAASLLRHLSTFELTWDHDLFQNFTNALRLSQLEEVEMPTRLHAAEAASELIPVLIQRSGEKRLNEADHIHLLLTLYDLLNDDDEDIRRVAATAVHRLNYRRHSYRMIIGSCAVAARESLVLLLSSEFRDSHLLASHACSRIIGAPVSVAIDQTYGVVDFCRRNPIGTIIRILLDRASELFTEERQNLYVDDVAEVQIWATVFAQCDLASFEPPHVASITEWVCDGLRYLASLLQLDDGPITHEAQRPSAVRALCSEPLGVTYNAEVLIIFVRVIFMAGLLRRSRSSNLGQLGGVEDQVNRISHCLQRLRSICLHTRAQEQVLQALEESLSDS